MKLCGKIFMFAAAVVFAFFAGGVSEAAEGRIRIGIATFESKVKEIGATQAAIITDIFSNTLYNSKRIQLVERERMNDLLDEVLGGDTGFYDADTVAEIGRLAGIQYILLGSVIELVNKASSGGIPIPIFKGVIGGGQTEATAKITLRVVKVETGEVILSLSENGRSTNSAAAFSLAGVTWGEGEFGGIEARAIGDAALRLAHKIREKLADEYSYVIEAGEKELMIDEGETRAVEPGMLFLVYSDGRALTDMSGNPLGRKRIPLAVLKVNRTDFDVSYCSAAPGTKSSLIRRGDKIEPIGSAEAGKMVKDKMFPSKRPEGLMSGLAEEILGEIGQKNPSVPVRDDEEPVPGLSPAPVPDPVLSIKPLDPVRPPQKKGVDPNTSSGVEVISTYSISQTDKNTLGIQHRGAWNLYSKKNYKAALDRFAKLADAYPDDNYLSAYWAGMSALKIRGRREEASGWFERALDINPDYQPAIDALEKL